MSPFENCNLCPHGCGADRTVGERGMCASADAPVVALASLHQWEEPPISGEAGSGTIFFSGCTLRCVYCQNRVISREGVGRRCSVEELAEMCLDLERRGAMNVNMVTPTHYAPAIRDAVRLARRMGMRLPVVWNTSGYETVQAIEDNASVVDVYLTDFKYMDPVLSQAYSGVSDYAEVATAALDVMVRCAGLPVYDEFDGVERMMGGVIVRHLLLPGALDDSKRVIEHLAQRYGTDIRISIMNQYTPVLASAAEDGDDGAARILEAHQELAYAVSNDEYEELLDWADSLGMEDYFWQDGQTCKESFIPDFCAKQKG